jgi:hypothetical protein
MIWCPVDAPNAQWAWGMQRLPAGPVLGRPAGTRANGPFSVARPAAPRRMLIVRAEDKKWPFNLGGGGGGKEDAARKALSVSRRRARCRGRGRSSTRRGSVDGMHRGRGAACLPPWASRHGR